MGNVEVSDRSRDGSSAPLLSLEGLTVRGGDHLVLNGVDLAVGAGARVAVTGPDSAGLTALAGALAGSMAVEAGAIRFRGAPMQTLGSGKRRAQGLWVSEPQRPINFGKQVIDEVVVGSGASRRGLFTGLLGRGPGGPERTEGVEALQLVGLGDRIGMSAAALWSLDRTRLEIARAVVARAPLLVLDRPANGLSIEEGGWLGALLDKLSARGATVVMIDRDADTMRRVAPRIVLLQDGRKVADDTATAMVRNAHALAAYPHWEDA